LVVQDGVIVYVGDDDGAQGWAADRVVDLGGRWVTPGFVDAHVHLVQTGQVMTGIDLSRAVSRDEVLRLVAVFARAHPERRVIVGQGWDEGRWADPRPPERLELDRAGHGAAIYLARVDVHSAVVSSALLHQLPDIAAEPGFTNAGLLTREAHHRCRIQMDSLFSDDERRAAAGAALRRAAQVGICAVHELGGPALGPLEDLVRVREVAAEVGIDVVTYWGELASAEAFGKARSVGAAGLAGDLCVDGAIGSRTAAMVEPYADADTNGIRYLSLEEVTQHVIGCTRAGLQAGFHCIGDDAVQVSVEGFRRAAAVVGDQAIRDRRHRLEHLEMAADDEVATLARLGVVASMQPAFDTAWGGPGDLYEHRLGRERAVAMNRLGTLHRAGVPLAFGSDSPVTPLTGWSVVRSAVEHHQPLERMSARAAFEAATRGGHWAAGDDHAGRLTRGARASFAVWDGADHLADDSSWDFGGPSPHCVLTVASGRTAFQSGEVG
jgi:predicted amidohydrolase YtcJ